MTYNGRPGRRREQVAIFREPDDPNRFGSVFAAFGALLLLYVMLLIAGPAYVSPGGIAAQVVSAKAIVDTSVASIFVQAYGAKRTVGEWKRGGTP